MMEKPTKRFWQFPWKYKESFLIVASLLLLGFLLEVVTKNKPLFAPAFPMNAIILGIFVIYKIVTYKFNGAIIKWLHSSYAAIAGISAFVFLVALMGFIKQEGYIPIISDIGLTHIKTSWPYLFIVVFLLTALGYTIIHRIATQGFAIRNIAFVLNHLGLFVVLAGGTMGYSDFYQFKMYLVEGKIIDFAYLNNKALKMPFELKLNDFTIEEYQPQLVLIDPSTGEIIMKREQGQWPKVKENAEGWLEEKDEWYFMINDYLVYADLVDSNFVESKRFGAVQAAQVSMANKGLGIGNYGWISCGNYWHQTQVLKLADNLALGMTYPKPKRFSSYVDFIVDGDTLKRNYEIAVNKPLAFGSWRFYQTSYNEKFGRWSDTSVLQVVRDPWLPFVYVGFFMVLLGSIFLLFGKKQSDNKLSDRK